MTTRLQRWPDTWPDTWAAILAATWAGRWPQVLLQRLLPCACALCGETADEVVCRPCQRMYAAPGGLRCVCCANPLSVPSAAAGSGQRCGACLATPPAFDATLAAVDYAAPLDALVLGLKFGGRLPLAAWCAQRLLAALAVQPDWPRPDLLCAVPLGPRRLAARGFNQALEIARPLARALHIEVPARLALRTRDTVAQSSVVPAERAGNIRGAFKLAPAHAHRVAGRHVGVVDDVMTSGHTLNEFAATLKAAGAVRVTNLVFARTPPH